MNFHIKPPQPIFKIQTKLRWRVCI